MAFSPHMVFIFAISLSLLGDPALAPTRVNFEGPDPTWQLAESDCGARLARQLRTFDKPRSGHSCEHAQLLCGRGSYAYLTHEVAPSSVIPELVPRLWFRSNRPGGQLLARVVLPRTENPRDGRPLSILVRGATYEDVGAWQQLSIEDVSTQVRRQEPVLRTKYGTKVDVREAYLDLLVLNVFGGQGSVDVWLDDLELAGHVAAPAESLARPVRQAANESPDAAEGATPRDEDRVHLHGSVLSAAGRPLLVRAIEHRGEPFAWLQGLGFNTIALADPPSREQLVEARRLGLWLVCPPPHFDGRDKFSTAYDRVLAWDLGHGLTRRELEERRRQADEVRLSDANCKRPIVCSAQSQLSGYSRLADVLRFDHAPLGSSLELSEYGPWLRERARLARPGTPFWAVVQTEPMPRVTEQLLAFGLELRGPLSVETDQIRLLALHAIAAGARGLQFSSRGRLDATDPATQSRAVALRLLNRELMLIEPWGAGGSFDRELETSDPLAQAAVLQTDRSRLLLITRHLAGQQFVSGPAGKEPVSLVDSGATSSPQAYLIGATGIVPIRNRRRDSGGLRLTLEDVPLAAVAVLTQDPLVVNHLTRQPALPKGILGRAHHESAARNLLVAEEVDRRLTAQSHPFDSAAALLADARANLKQSERVAAAEDDGGAMLFAARAERAIARVRRGHWETAVAGFPSPVASPFCLQFETLPGHWQMADRLRAGRWGGNALAGGEMEDLNQMLRAGWKYERHVETSLQATVDLAPAAVRSGRYGLRLRSFAADDRSAPRVVEVPPIRIASGPIPMQQGQIARINGWVKLPQPIGGSRDGLLVLDSLGGEALAQRITKSGEWQEFTLYRAAPRAGDLHLSFVLSGLGEAWVDDVSVMVLESPVADRR